jgi:hypothetical protein
MHFGDTGPLIRDGRRYRTKAFDGEKSFPDKDLRMRIQPRDPVMRRGTPVALGTGEHGRGATPPDRRIAPINGIPMKIHATAPKPAPMSADAYAGFLKLWLTPTHKLPSLDNEVRAYLRHVSDREPLSGNVREALGQPTRKAA